MNSDLVLLFISASFKILTLVGISVFLLKKWLKQSHKYYTDFPFLMSWSFFILGVGKIIDMILYYAFRDTPDFASLDFNLYPTLFVLAKNRFIISPVLSVFPMVLLMLIIWFGNKQKIQFTIGITWGILSIVSILIADQYSILLTLNAIIAIPAIILSIITFFVIHQQKKLQEINSLILGIGWSLFLITQLLRPIWKELGNGLWGLSWLGELLELLALIIIGFGFIIPSHYKDREKGTNNELKRVK